ncbi:DUF411 domain-containing protein [Polaromonas sp. AER18D-145]|uniref:DUF411 domain-containing protein n=1 Tax=Polaromonas sp. AER18D-145 TaxID=1977060 RepID=UPI00352A8C1F
MAMPNTSIDVFPRRSILRLSLAAAGAMALGQPLRALAAADAKQITVWKNPDCGCCLEWVAHLRKNGFEVVTQDVKDTAPVRKKLGLPDKFGSCHTARLGDYVLEGHVPARELQRLLREKPHALGLAVPGMPVGSPGMEMGDARDAYDVLLVLKDGSSRIYQSYPSKPPAKS